MEPFLLILETWWWTVPAAVAAGAGAYAGLTTRSRRARRLELDAARHEHALAYRALISSRARVSEAQANVLAARAQSGAPAFGTAVLGTAAMNDARARMQEAKRAEKAAALGLRAARARVKAASVQYHGTRASDPLPIATLFAAHNAVTARWLAYETDPAKALAFPQMLDSRHPATVAFLRAQRAAQDARPASERDRIPPEQYVRYREAVRALEVAFDEAEWQAGAAERPAPARIGMIPLPGWWMPRPPLSR
ncbi:hypothetical protein [Microbacterium sp. 2FI]|uniref:hypothetical protein n=1 Tax=Microbacterium sp. 2FI TaxID=2502193 RepID=UPI0010F5DC1D|nr:hypothetical protein [Microbacterium sp. 2FI]